MSNNQESVINPEAQQKALNMNNLHLSLSLCLTLTLFTVGITVTVLLPASTCLSPARLVLGLIAFLFVPGFLFVRLLGDGWRFAEKVGFSFIIGLLVLEVNSDFWQAGSLFFTLNFSLALTVSTVLWVLVLLFFQWKFSTIRVLERRGPLFSRFSNYDFALFFVFIASFLLRLFYQSFSNAPFVDGSLYLDTARNVVMNGSLSSKVIFLGDIRLQLGFIPHEGVIYLLSLFFSLGDISYFSGKLMVVLVGSLLLFPVYGIARTLYDERAGLIAAVLVAFNPLLIIYSSILFGPEILGTLFLLSSFYLFLLSMRSKRWLYSVLGGAFGFFTLIIWAPCFYVLVASIPFVVILTNGSRHWKKCAAYSILMTAYFLFASRFVDNMTYGLLLWYIGVPLLLSYGLIKRRDKQWLSYLCVFLLVVYLMLYVTLARNFYYPELYVNSATSDSATSIITGNINSAMTLKTFADSVYGWWRELFVISPIFFFLGFLSLSNLSNARKNLIVFVMPVMQTIIFGYFASNELTSSVIDRMLLASVVFFLILSAAFLSDMFKSTQAILGTDFRLKVQRRFEVKLPTTRILASLTILLVALGFLMPFYLQYEDGVNRMETVLDPVSQNHWGPAIDWVNKNVDRSDVIAARGVQNWAWSTNRRTVELDGLNSTSLSDIITEYNVSYVIVDHLFYQYNPHLSVLYENPSRPPLGFDLVFKDNSTFIYNVTKIRTTTPVNFTNTLDGCNSLGNWAMVYGNLTINNVDHVKENSSLSGVSIMDSADRYISKFKYQPQKPIDLSNAAFIEFWCWTNVSVTSSFVQLFDDRGSWQGYYFNPAPNTWQKISINLMDVSSGSQEPDLHNIKSIVFWFDLTKEPYEVRIDSLQTVTVVLK